MEQEVVKRIKLLGQGNNISRDTFSVDSNVINRRSKLADQEEQELAQLRRGKKLAVMSTECVSNEEGNNSSSDNNSEDREADQQTLFNLLNHQGHISITD